MKTTTFGAMLLLTLLAAMPVSAATLTTLVSFNGTNGAAPLAGLIADASGTLYGTTGFGGMSNRGTVFSLSSSGTLTTLVNFNGANGDRPGAGLFADASGTLYGTTPLGGTSGRGTVFSLSSSGALTTLVNFNGANGQSPLGTLIADASGTLYGTTSAGGASNDGTVFSLSSSGTLTTLASFDSVAGFFGGPRGGLIADASGTLYGTTTFGGVGGRGTVFSLSSSGTLTTLVNFDGTNGFWPYGELIADASGTCYGTTSRGGPSGGDGTVFNLSRSGTLTTLVNF